MREGRGRPELGDLFCAAEVNFNISPGGVRQVLAVLEEDSPSPPPPRSAVLQSFGSPTLSTLACPPQSWKDGLRCSISPRMRAIRIKLRVARRAESRLAGEARSGT